MKRSGPIQRRTPLARGTKGLAPGSGLKRGKGPAPTSAKRDAERDVRAMLVDAAIGRSGGRCELAFLATSVHRVPCHGPLVGHEVGHRSTNPGSHLVADLIVAVCVGHNNWEAAQPLGVAESVGARAPGWAVDRYGAAAVGEECRRIRREWSLGGDPGAPFWESR